MKKFLFTTIIALFVVGAVSAQDKGKWGVGPKIGLYTNAGGNGVIFGIGAAARYSFSDNLRIEPAITALCRRGCSLDISADVHYLFKLDQKWSLYPLAGLSANDIDKWTCGVNLGGGADFSVARNWDVSAGLKWMIQMGRWHKNPIIIQLGTTYKF